MSLGRLGTLLVFAIGMTLFAARAGAQVIIDPFDPIRSTLQSSYIAISGQTAGEPDLCSDQRCGNFVVTIRNFANDPVAGSAVMIDFSGCTDIQLACDQLTASTGQTYLGNKRVVGQLTEKDRSSRMARDRRQRRQRRKAMHVTAHVGLDAERERAVLRERVQQLEEHGVAAPI